MCSKANRTLGFLRRNLFSCSKNEDVKETAYKTLVRPILEYGSTVWDPHCNGLNDEYENVQKRAAQFVTRNYSYETGSMTGILEELKWETLKKRRKDNRLILLYPRHLCRRVYSFRLSVCPFVRSYVRSFVRSWNLRQSFALKFLKWCISQQLLIRKHSYLDHSYPGGLAFTP